MAAAPEVDSSKQKQVVKNKVGTDVSSSRDVGRVAGVEVPGVAQLHDEQDDPVDRDNNRVQSKRRMSARVLTEDGVTVVLALARLVEGVVERHHNKEKP